MAKGSGKVAILVLAGVVVAGLLTWMVAFEVNFTEYVLVQTFGETTAVLDGKTDAGLRFKWPLVQTIERYDARTHVFEDTMNELSTNDKQNVILTTYCAWRITDPVKFQTNIGEMDSAEARIRTKLRSRKSAVIGRRNMADLVNTDPQKMRIGDIEEEILSQVSAEAERDYGVEVVRVGIKSLGLPVAVSEKVIEAMKEERQREAATFESAGEAQAEAIRERARAAAQKILAFAQRKAGEIRSEGDRDAAKLYRQFEKNWQLAAYLRTLEALRTELEGRSIFLLDGSELPAVKYFRDGPSLPTSTPAGPPEGPATGGAAASAKPVPPARQKAGQ